MTMIDDTPFSSPSVAFFDSAGALLMIGPKNLPMPPGAASWSPLPTGYSDETHSWNSTSRTMVEDASKVEAKLISTVKADADRRKMTLLSRGDAKSTEYADQAAEVRFFWSLGGTATAVMGTIGVWSSARRAAVFPCATANAAEFGDTIDKAIGRFSAGMARSGGKEAIAAREQKICANIKAAAAPSAKRAAAAAAAWPA